ncbi:MAG: ATPase [Clostridiales bacterium]|nr:ATPase [Clostridiales bacterium]
MTINMRYVAGLDGGGSKTALYCLDKEGNCLHKARFGTLNINGAEVSVINQTIKEIILFLSQFEIGLSGCAGITIATAGVSNPQAMGIIKNALYLAGYQGEFMLQGDHEAALRGAVGKFGVILIAGTGSICFGRSKDGTIARSGGWGYLLDDEGSGYAIGRDMLKAVFRAEDGRNESTILTEVILKHFQAENMGELLRFVYKTQTSKAQISGLAPLLQAAVNEGDVQSSLIVQRAGLELLQLVRAVLDKLQLVKAPLALAGGVLENIPAIREEIQRILNSKYPTLDIIKPRHSAAWGAADLARESYL